MSGDETKKKEDRRVCQQQASAAFHFLFSVISTIRLGQKLATRG